jgi:hypothetical protein
MDQAAGGDDVETPEAALIAKMEAEEVRKAVASLPLHFREVVVLREIHDLDYRTIAEVIQVPIGLHAPQADFRRLPGERAVSFSEQDELFLNAYLDDELAPIEAVRFEQRLAVEPALANKSKRGARSARAYVRGLLRMCRPPICVDA